MADGFNRGFDAMARILRLASPHAGQFDGHDHCFPLVFCLLIYGTFHMFQTVPRGFIPTMDQGYAIVVVQLPEGSSLGRTDAVVQTGVRHRPQNTGRPRCGCLRRLLRRDLYERQQCWRDFRAVQQFRGTAQSRTIGRSKLSARYSAVSRASAKRSSSCCRRLPYAASAIPVASKCSFRSAAVPMCAS